MTSATAGPFLAVAALLAVAGIAKVIRPAATARALGSAGLPGSAALGTPVVSRALGTTEVAVAAAAALTGTRSIALLVAAFYLSFAAFAALLLSRGGAPDCGCFGNDESPVTAQHVGLNLGAAALAGVAAVSPPGPLADVLADQPFAGIPFLVFVAICTWLGMVSFTLLPRLSRAASDAPSERDAGR